MLQFKLFNARILTLRVAYDFAAAAFATLALGLANSLPPLAQAEVPTHFLLAIVSYPFLVVASLALGGLYSRFKVSGARFKAGLITLILATLAVAYALFGFTQAPHAILLFALTGPALVAPRIFLNVGYSKTGAALKKTLDSRGPILIVGGAGYIGTHLVDLLLASGDQRVRVLDSFLYGNTLEKFKNNPRLEIIEGDVSDISKLSSAMLGCSSVVHLAGLVGDPACSVDEDFTRHTNVICTRMIMEVAKSFGIQRFVFASSCSVYGISEEEANETSPLNPVSLYAVTKIDSEKELLSSRSDTFHPVILRFATVFGGSERPRFDLVGNLFSAHAFFNGKLKVIGSGNWRPFIHCRDIARALKMSLEAPLEKVSSQVFNVGDDRQNLTILGLAEVVANQSKQILGKDIEIDVQDGEDDRRNYRVSFAKIRNSLGFEAEHDVDTGIRDLLNQLKNGEFEDISKTNFSNVATTRIAAEEFRSPQRASRIYTPLSETLKA